MSSTATAQHIYSFAPYRTLTIVSRHDKLSDAVNAAGIDLSYNESLARADLARDDRDRFYVASFVVRTEDGETEVWSVGVANDGLRLLNKYTPFHSTMCSRPFSVVSINVEESRIEITKPIMHRSNQARATLAKLDLTVTVI